MILSPLATEQITAVILSFVAGEPDIHHYYFRREDAYQASDGSGPVVPLAFYANSPEYASTNPAWGRKMLYLRDRLEAMWPEGSTPEINLHDGEASSPMLADIGAIPVNVGVPVEADDRTVGLFGTCGGSRWRERFIRVFDARGIAYYNPQVGIDEWEEAMVDLEARHLATDPIILFPVTGETYGTGSLTECGFSILNAIRLDERRDFVIMIERELDPALDNVELRRESLRARALVGQHLRKLRLPNVYIVGNLDEMLEITLSLHSALLRKAPLKKYNPQNL